MNPMMSDIEQIRKLERAERAYDERRASLKQSSDLRVPSRIFRRYQAPPADTPFAIEYSYNLLGDVRGKDVLDLGCGDGENTVQLAHRGARVCGVDLSVAMVNLARRRAQVNGFVKGAEFGVGSAHELPFRDRSFDVVFGMAVLTRLNLELASREVWRVLRPGGYAIFKEPVRNSRLIRMTRRLVRYRPPGQTPFGRPLTDQELERFTAEFSQCHGRRYQLPFVNVARWFSVLDGVWTLFYQLDHALLEHAEWLRRYATVRVIKVVK
jgi:SAM-dependent methyltransferase